MTSEVDSPRRPWWPLALTLFTFFLLVGHRSLNEPDEGRYAEIAREMIELNDWLVPHLWYQPHLDKPPLTYWTVAASLCVFGENEWAVRLPLALAGISGVWVSYLFGCALGGRRVGVWSALILQSSLLYFVMARMLTTDILLTQFLAWALYFFWRSWRSLHPEAAEKAADAGGANAQLSERGQPCPHVAPQGQGLADKAGRAPTTVFLGWHLAGWTMVALGFLAKGPMALAVPIVALTVLAVCRRRDVEHGKTLGLGMLAGLLLFGGLVAPWFWLVSQRLPLAPHFMIFGQVVGHVLGTTIKNRRGHPLYYFAILGVGFLPWTWLLGWLWRRAHWQRLKAEHQEAWAMLSVWVLFTFVLFSLTRSKLPAYILPMFPALAVMVALRFFGSEPGSGDAPSPGWAWRLCAVSPVVLMAVIAVIVPLVFQVDERAELNVLATVAVAALGLLVWRGRKWSRERCAAVAVALGLLSMQLIAAGTTLVETSLKRNQTLKPLGLALQREWRPGVTLVCWGRLPQGLPFYAHPVISAANRPYLGGMALDQVPFEFTGNRDRFGDRILPDEKAMMRLLAGESRILVVGLSGSLRHFQQLLEDKPLKLLASVGQWELFGNR